jgi:hypothetical protein
VRPEGLSKFKNSHHRESNPRPIKINKTENKILLIKQYSVQFPFPITISTLNRVRLIQVMLYWQSLRQMFYYDGITLNNPCSILGMVYDVCVHTSACIQICSCIHFNSF